MPTPHMPQTKKPNNQKLALYILLTVFIIGQLVFIIGQLNRSQSSAIKNRLLFRFVSRYRLL